MGGSKWIKAKLALGLKLNSCLYVPRPIGDVPAADGARSSDSALVSSMRTRASDRPVRMPTSPTPSSSGLRVPKASSRSCEKICAICLGSMKPGHGHAIFTAECSHSFHFGCIASNVKHGRQNCPVCRAKWKEIPFQSPAIATPPAGVRINNVPLPQHDAWFPLARRLPSPRADHREHAPSPFQAPEPGVYDDDDEVESELSCVTPSDSSLSNDTQEGHFTGVVEVETYPEVSAIPRLKSHNNFLVLVHLKAPSTRELQHSEFEGSRAPLDLVTILDVSGSMAGSKLALLKRAMGFVIQNLGHSDRLSVIAFSSTARRLFPLRRMTDTGREVALRAVNSLISNGGTNIVEGLKKGAKVMTDRKWKNPVSSIILLSDGQDRYNVCSPNGATTRAHYKSLLPESLRRDCASGLHIPVHAFGFGADHDAALMHLISETSGGTFSFIETDNAIQDAFAQCIGGLLSVTVQELKIEVECIHPMLRIVTVKSGSYQPILSTDSRTASIAFGDLCAEEERDFLVTIDIPADGSIDEMPLLKVRCTYKSPVSKNSVTLESANDVKIQRPLALTGPVEVSTEVDRQRNRLQSAEAMADAKAAAERDDLTSAVSVLENCIKQLLETISAKTGDPLCLALVAELREMQERMINRQVYETSGRAYVLSGLSSHSWQRATARGNSADSGTLVQAYQTPSMVDMVNLSQTHTMSLGEPLLRPVTVRHTRSSQPRRQQKRFFCHSLKFSYSGSFGVGSE